MATTGLAASAGTKFDATTPPKDSLLPPDLAKQLLVDLSGDVEALKSNKEFDLEGLMWFQRAANYLYVTTMKWLDGNS
jgi:hypothetical protein